MKDIHILIAALITLFILFNGAAIILFKSYRLFLTNFLKQSKRRASDLVVLSLLTVVCFAYGSVKPPPKPDTPSVKYEYEYDVLKDGTISLVDISPIPEGTFYIPNEIDGRLVTEIDNDFLEQEKCANITALVLPSTVKYIGTEAFTRSREYGGGINSISIQGGENEYFSTRNGILYDKVNKRVIMGCANLTRAILPSDCEIIDECAFFGCKDLEEISWPNSLKEIRGEAFVNCPKLKDLDLSNTSLEYVSQQAFALTGLESVIFPDTLQEIGGYLFGYCENLRNVTFLGDAPDVILKYDEIAKNTADGFILGALYATGDDPESEKTQYSRLLNVKTYVNRTEGWEDALGNPVWDNVSGTSIVFMDDDNTSDGGDTSGGETPDSGDRPEGENPDDGEESDDEEEELNREYPRGVVIEPILLDKFFEGVVSYKVKSLPAGLKFTAKAITVKATKTTPKYDVPANAIYGAPTKSGVYIATITAVFPNKTSIIEYLQFIVRNEGEKIVLPIYEDITLGTVKGAGVYIPGKKVTLRATATKGNVFAGWYEDEAFTSACDSTIVDFRTPSLTYIMGKEDKKFYPRFVPSTEDTKLDLIVNGIDVNDIDNSIKFNIFDCKQLKLYVDSLSLPKISVKGLPSGMKFTTKPIYKKGSKTEVETFANTIYGAPTKPGLYTIKVSLANLSIKKARVKEFIIEVPNFTAANKYFVDSLDNAVGQKYHLTVGDSNIGDYLPKLKLNSATAKLAVKGLPSGLRYDAKAGKIIGKATRPGTYTVYLTVTDAKIKYVSTITIEVERR